MPKIITRLLLLTLFFTGVYGGVHIIDLGVSGFVQSRMGDESSAVKTTAAHFRQPDFSVLQKGRVNKFLENITNNKSGLLAQKSFYVFLLGCYLFLGCCSIVFILGIESKKKSEKNLSCR